MKRITNFLIIVCCFLFQSCVTESPKEIVLFNFENSSDLDRLHWRCHTLFSISDKHAFGSLNSLKVEFYPSTYPGVTFKDYKKNWQGYERLSIDIFNPDKEKTEIVIRIDDYPNNISFSDRYNKKFVLLPGENNILIPFSELKTSGAGRKLNIETINKFLIFSVKPKKKIQLFIDNIKLTK